MRCAIATVVLAGALLLTACNQLAEGSVIFLTSGSDKQRQQCEDAFGGDEPQPFEDGEGAKWAWHLSANGASDQWCRKDRSGQLSAWAEAESAEAATHKLTFNGGDQPAVFQPLPER